jgi:hypothetical protein
MMHTAPEIYTIPFGDKSVIYRPQRHVAFIGNSALARYVLERDSGIAAGADPDIERFLQDAGFDGPALECSLPEIGGEVRPTGADDQPLQPAVHLLLRQRRG